VYFHNILASIFFVELLIKILGLGCRTYWKELFNRFDCAIVLLSAVDMLVTYGLQVKASSALIAIRAFRLLRIFKLARTWP